MALLLARFRLAVGRRPDLLRRPPWYQVEGARIRALAAEVKVDPDRALQAAATLSPAVQWEPLVRHLPAFLRAFRAAAERGEEDQTAPPKFAGYRRNVLKAWRILAGHHGPRGPKVSRFALNLSGDESPVTVDRWAARACGLPDSGGAGWYRRVEGAYQEAARVAGLPPSRLQSILWVAVREGVVQWGPPEDDGVAFRLFEGAGDPLRVPGSLRIDDRGDH